MALKRRCPEAGLLHHSDQGCPYASEDYQRLLDANGITCSMNVTDEELRRGLEVSWRNQGRPLRLASGS